jgi:hypothetical protein
VWRVELACLAGKRGEHGLSDFAYVSALRSNSDPNSELDIRTIQKKSATQNLISLLIVYGQIDIYVFEKKQLHRKLLISNRTKLSQKI